SKSWNGLPWTNGVDAVVNWGNGKAYFFKGNEYVRWDIKTDKADPGYPKTIDSKSWNGLIWTNSINVADNSGDIKKSSSIGIDAVDNWGNGKAYFFKGNEYIRFDISADKADPGYPKKIDSKSWNGLPWTNGVDAVVNWGNGKAYFFKGNEYLRWDITTDKADPGYPKPIDSKSWNGLPWTNGVDAVVNWGNGKAYFFKGNEYVRFDITTDKADPGYPKPIDSKSWNGLPWTNGVDAVVNWGNGKAYFFKGNEYIRWDIKTDKADPGYPKKIDDKSWPGLWK
ncbi:MAG: hypothetical protein KA807_17755, partial [Prolixibacteraceae bacterium]|nr:hypothetical protein [Prolixibacteraceae bacterium]